MPDSRRIRVGQPSRPSRLNASQSLDPTLTRKGALAHPGSFIVAIAGMAFFAYAFNLGGVKQYLDGVFGNFDAKMQSHNGDVTHYIVVAFPYVAVAAGALLLFFFLSVIGQAARGLFKKPKPKRATKSAKPAAASAAAPAAQEVIKPMRLAIRELDMKPTARAPSSAPSNERSAAE
jgi:hypothetical protein